MEIFPSTDLLMVGFKTPQGLVYKIWYRYDDGIQTPHQLEYTLFINDDMLNNQSYKL